MTEKIAHEHLECSSALIDAARRLNDFAERQKTRRKTVKYATHLLFLHKKLTLLPPANEVSGRQCVHRCLSICSREWCYLWSHVLSRGGYLWYQVPSGGGYVHPSPRHGTSGLIRLGVGTWDTTGYGLQAGGVHPTRMLSCE